MPKKRRSAQAERNPFIIGHLAEGEGFADRDKEVARICAALRDSRSRVLVYGDRRMGKSSTLRTVAAVIRIAGPRTRDVVQLARVLWDRTRSKGSAGTEDVVETMDLLVVEQAALHQKLWLRLHDVARKVLLLLATDPKAEVTGAGTLGKHNLGPKTTVHRVLKDLVEGEVLVEAVEGGHLFDDPFFRRWVQLNVLQDVGQEAPPLLAIESP